MPERARILRAEALVALVEALPASCGGHVRSNTSLPAVLQGLVAEEKSAAIRNLLHSAQRRFDTIA